MKLKVDTGAVETTKKTTLYNITSKCKNKPIRYKSVFIADQPGIGGLEVKEADYLKKFGPGHFNFTLMLSDKIGVLYS